MTRRRRDSSRTGWGGRPARRAVAGLVLTALASGLTGGCHRGGGGSAAPASLVARGDGQSGAVGSTLPTPVGVTVVDAAGNPVGGVAVSFQITGGGGSLSAAQEVSDATGVAEVQLTLPTTAGTVTVRASEPSGLVANLTAVATADAAAALRFVTQPGGAPPEADLPPVSVEVVDAFGNRVTGSSAAVTLSIGTDPSGGVLSFRAPGSASLTAVAGVASFSHGGIDLAGSGYTLVASATGLASATSQPLDVAARAAEDGLGHLDSGTMNFERSGVFDDPSPVGFDEPVDVLVDTAEHRLFVADSSNHRVLVFELSAADRPRSDRRHATWVLGQADMTSVSAGLAQDRLNRPVGLAYDATRKRLFVADLFNDRVVVFDLSGGISTGMSASFVLGQADFSTGTGSTSQTGLDFPLGLQYDAGNDRLYVADAGNRRVVVHSTASLSSGQAAQAVLGQPDFTTSAAAVTRAGMSDATGLALDAANQRLFVSDSVVHRVLIFDVATISDGEDAAGVLGQGDFTSSGTATSSTGLANPWGLEYQASTGRLFVSDSGNYRVLVWDAQSPDGVAASHVLGQADFVTPASPAPSRPSRATLWSPTGLDVAGDALWAAESNAHRVVVHDLGALADGQDAAEGLGHPDATVMSFTRGAHDDGGATPRAFGSFLGGVALDPAGHRLFAVGSSQNRVLVFSLSGDDDLVGQSRVAQAVLGQPDEVSAFTGLSASGLYNPVGVAWDPVLQRLYVADSFNNRVLGFEAADLVTGGSASLVLGQPDFTTNAAGAPAATTLLRPTRVAVDPGQRLFVADAGNNRVLIYDNAASLTNGGAATSAIGQTDLNGAAAGLGVDRLDAPDGLAYDAASQRLYVADSGNDRVLVFDVSSSAGDGRSALHVLGQASFATNGASTSRAGLSQPQGLAIDAAVERLYVADFGNNRVVVHDLSTLSDGQEATSYLGQETGFGVGGAASGATRLSGPRGVALVPGGEGLFVSDQGNHRVLLFATP